MVTLVMPEVPATVTVYVPGVVPVFPPPPLLPPLPPPPQPIALMETKMRRSPIITSQLRRRFGTMKNTTNASAVPPAGGQKSFFIWFSALDAAVVVTVSVDVCEAVPLIATDIGFRLQVGISLTFVITVATVQVRVTVPGVTVMEVVPPLPAVKLG